MKFATHILLFGQEKWVLRNLENVYPHVDKIYASYSPVPWLYNRNARIDYKNTFDLDLIRNSKFIDKIEIIEGVWDTDEAQRNSCAEAAFRDGMNYLFTIDADEFYFHKDLEKIKEQIVNNPDHDYYKAYWICFWKNFSHCLIDQNNSIHIGTPEICINLKKDVRFNRCRIPNKSDWFMIPLENGVCYHGSYVLTDDEVWKKINTWGHAHQFNTKEWFEQKWLNWNKDSKNLHPISPSAWSQAVEFKGELPEVIKNLR